MTKSKVFLTLTLPFLLYVEGALAAKSPTESVAVKRTEIQVSEQLRAKFRQPSELLRMVTLTPIIDGNDEVTCMQISAIRDPVIKDVMKARVGDCLAEVRIFREERNGTVKEVYPVLSATDAMLLYKDLNGASRVEIDLLRNKQMVALTYIVN